VSHLTTLLITYDLNQPGQNYVALHDAIKNVGTNWWHHLDSTWLVKASKDAKQVRDELMVVMDTSDKLLVIDVTSRHRAWRGFNASGSAWLDDIYE